VGDRAGDEFIGDGNGEAVGINTRYEQKINF